MTQVYKLNHDLTLKTETCCECSMVFAMTAEFKQRMHDTKGTFYCPAGHGQHYVQSPQERLRKQLDEQVKEATRQAQRAAEAERALKRAKAAEKRAKTTANKLKKDFTEGKCPCCGKIYVQLARHIAKKHPELEAENGTETD